MINILTYPEDQTTHHVADWLNYKNKPFQIMNAGAFYNAQAVSIQTQNNSHPNQKTFWFRKWRNPGKSREEREAYFMQIDAYYDQNNGCYWLNNPSDLHKNKGIQLNTARSCGLSVPDTLITKNKDEIKYFIKNHERSIIKFSDLQSKQAGSKAYLSYTQIITPEKLDKVKLAAPCIVQEYIEKEVEIRTFFLNGKCYSMAIFSQNDEQTKIDFRKYNYKKPNRNVPFQLPAVQEKQVADFMQQLRLNCGSLDIILTPDNRFVFLEVNPVGQFGMVSYPCNYYLEEKVARLLTEKSCMNEQSK